MALKTELVEKAKSLGIEVKEDVVKDDDALQGLIDAKEAENTEKERLKVDPEYYKKEAEKAYSKRDEAKEERRKMAEKVKELEEKLKGAANSDEVAAVKKELTDLREFKTKADKEREEKELASKTEVERKEIQIKKQAEEFQKSLKEAEERWQSQLKEMNEKLSAEQSEKESLRRQTLDGQIIRAASKYNAVSPSQIVRLLKDDFIFDKETGQFLVFIKDPKGKITDEMTVDEYTESFLKKDENSNLVKSKVDSSGLDLKSSQTTTTSTTSSGKYDPKDPKIKREADDRGLSVEDYIEILGYRDAKNKKIDENRKKI